MSFIKPAGGRHGMIHGAALLLLLSTASVSFGQHQPEGKVVIFCKQLNEEYDKKTDDRDYMTIIKIYKILESGFDEATPHERELIIKNIQKGFRFDSPAGATRDFRLQGADCLTVMGTEGLEALLFNLEQDRVELAGADRLVQVLDEAYEKRDPLDEKKITVIYDIFHTVYDKAGTGERGKILKAMERAFHVATADKEGEFKIAAAGHLAGMDTPGLQTLLVGLTRHRSAQLSYPQASWSSVVKPLRDVLYDEYEKKRQCDEEKVILVFELFTELFGLVSSGEQRSFTAYIVKASRELPLPDKDASLLAGADALARMGKPGLDSLEHLLKSDRLDGAWQVLERVIIAMGRTRSPAALDSLLQLLWNNRSVKVSAALKALSFYGELPLKERKPIVKEIVKVYAYLHALAAARNASPVQSELYYATRGDMNLALQKLTRKRFNTAPQWQKWYNDNKGKAKW